MVWKVVPSTRCSRVESPVKRFAFVEKSFQVLRFRKLKFLHDGRCIDAFNVYEEKCYILSLQRLDVLPFLHTLGRNDNEKCLEKTKAWTIFSASEMVRVEQSLGVSIHYENKSCTKNKFNKGFKNNVKIKSNTNVGDC